MKALNYSAWPKLVSQFPQVIMHFLYEKVSPSNRGGRVIELDSFTLVRQ